MLEPFATGWSETGLPACSAPQCCRRLRLSNFLSSQQAFSIAVARLFCYFGIGYLAVRYGEGALPFLKHHKLQVAGAAIAFFAVSYGLSQLILRAKHPYANPKLPAKIESLDPPAEIDPPARIDPDAK
jgi:hypothetical protein